MLKKTDVVHVLSPAKRAQDTRCTAGWIVYLLTPSPSETNTHLYVHVSCRLSPDSIGILRFVWGFFTVSPFRPPTRDQPCLSVTRTTRWRWHTPPSRSTRTSANTTIIWPRFWLLLCMSGWGANKHPVDLLWMMSFRLGLITQVFI